MSLTYASYVTSMANLLVVPENDAGYQTMLPNMIDDAENRMYRDLDLIDTVNIPTGQLSTTALPQSFPAITYSSPPYVLTGQSPVVVKFMNILTPLGATPETATGRYPLTPASVEMIQSLFPTAAGSTIPQYFAMTSQAGFILGPRPDAAYNYEVGATYRYDPLSVSNTITLFSLQWPDMLIAASMVFAAGYQRNFGAGSDDPKMAMTWESHYQTLLASASTEENRKRLTEQAIKQAIPPSPTPRV